MGRRRNAGRFIDEYRSRQRNIVFPDTVRNARLTYVFFLKGHPHPPLVQRIAAWIFGLMLIGSGLESLSLDVKARIEDGFSIGTVIFATISVAFILLGIRVFRNGFPRPTKQEDSK
jgi:hypothetical protein